MQSDDGARAEGAGRARGRAASPHKGSFTTALRRRILHFRPRPPDHTDGAERRDDGTIAYRHTVRANERPSAVLRCIKFKAGPERFTTIQGGAVAACEGDVRRFTSSAPTSPTKCPRPAAAGRAVSGIGRGARPSRVFKFYVPDVGPPPPPVKPQRFGYIYTMGISSRGMGL
ncbi:hypothetical protein EVAR_66069_1 [Eumeta japonica]|uniref:Uncharacterized protein n=1 Tax=Eumeta variegata TaxID=151549 RepID=A0A4C2A330_EUMVA|nr:hypothetical protein EVAR_66069_1 [Eumeta japonica]